MTEKTLTCGGCGCEEFTIRFEIVEGDVSAVCAACDRRTRALDDVPGSSRSDSTSRSIGDLAIRATFAVLLLSTVLGSMIGMYYWLPGNPWLLPKDVLGVLWGWAVGAVMVTAFQAAGFIDPISPETNSHD